MGTFSTKKILQGSPALIPTIADELAVKFQSDGFEVAMDALSSGGYDISITKGGVFKALLGMKSALKITLIPMDDCISFEAGIGIFGKQIIPSLITWYVAWPVLLTQIWGMVEQSKLDDMALQIAEKVIAENAMSQKNIANKATDSIFCTSCGTKISKSSKICGCCGVKL